MQILTLSDEVVQEVYSASAKERFRDVQMILGCGDLRPSYLEFAVSSLNVPCFYVPGNHDGRPESTAYGQTVAQPEGCINIDGRVVREGGLSIAGLGGSPWYNGEGFQYTERQMFFRVYLLALRLFLRQRRDGSPLDIMIAHAPPRGIHDIETMAHRGFEAFRWLIDRFKPRYFIHGHVHRSYGSNNPTETIVGRTTVINTSGYRVVNVTLPASVAGTSEHAAG